MAPHASTLSHFATETALLTTLYARSKAQHRSQIFLSRLQGVLRLSRRVIDALATDKVPSLVSASTSASTYTSASALALARAPSSSSTALSLLLPKFATALIHAAASSSAILDLAHFVPLHTTLLASYARLLSVTIALAAAMGMSQAALLLPTEPARRVNLNSRRLDIGSALSPETTSSTSASKVKKVEQGIEGEVGDKSPAKSRDFGEVIERRPCASSNPSSGAITGPPSNEGEASSSRRPVAFFAVVDEVVKESKSKSKSTSKSKSESKGKGKKRGSEPQDEAAGVKRMKTLDQRDGFGFGGAVRTKAGGGMDDIFAAVKRKKPNAPNAEAEAADADAVEALSKPKIEDAPNKQKKKPKTDELDDIFSPTTSSTKLKKKKKSDDSSKPAKKIKRKAGAGAMDAIFGF